MANTTNSSLAINNDVIAKIAGMAALEIDGVAELANKPIGFKDVKSAIKGSRSNFTASVNVTVDNGALLLDIFLKVYDTAKIKSVAEAVQLNVKEKVQSMTGNAVARVNVHVDDLLVAE